MKTFFFTLLVASTAFAGVNPVGKYEAERALFANYSYQSCKANGGTWIKSEKACIVKVNDEVTIAQEGENYSLSVVTYNGNLNSCDFSGTATLGKNNTLTSKIKVEDYISGKMVNCIVKAKLSASGQSVSISSNENCREFCGANAYLESNNLKKVK